MDGQIIITVENLMSPLCSILDTSLSSQLESLSKGATVQLIPIGGGMRPVIQEGRDKLIVARQKEVREGDIVLVTHEDVVRVHRVVDINQNLLTLMDDANLYGVFYCTVQNVLGTVVSIIRGRRKIHPGRGSLIRAVLPLQRLFKKKSYDD